MPKEKIPIPAFSRRFKKTPPARKSNLPNSIFVTPILEEEDQIEFYCERHTYKQNDLAKIYDLGIQERKFEKLVAAFEKTVSQNTSIELFGQIQ